MKEEKQLTSHHSRKTTFLMQRNNTNMRKDIITTVLWACNISFGTLCKNEENHIIPSEYYQNNTFVI